MSNVEQSIREYIVQNFMMGEEDGELGSTDSFLDTGLIDSTGVLELVEFIQDNYEIEVSDEEMLPENLDSISNIAAYIAKKKS